MSSDPRSIGAAPAYDEAEKGTHERPLAVVKPSYPADEKKDPFINDEKAVTVTAIPVKKDTPAAAPAARGPPKPKGNSAAKR